MSSDRRDKFGRSYRELLALQAKELRIWKQLLRPETYNALAEWCELVNGPAVDSPTGDKYRAGGLHSVPVGSEITQFLIGLKKPRLSKVDAALL